ncbi:MAG: hypothetical protein F6K28_28250, partial [Microcoleus sp. SIO2G3]|nr:hypothetical protein [Microcoleus sp. SIO2G3]
MSERKLFDRWREVRSNKVDGRSQFNFLVVFDPPNLGERGVAPSPNLSPQQRALPSALPKGHICECQCG